MALGPQNIFLIRQGAMRQHAVLSAIMCFLCDMLLVTLSVAGLHHLLDTHPGMRLWMAWLGAGFLMYYGGNALKNAFFPKNAEINSAASSTTRRQIILLALGFSLLNPHAIIDALVLIGGGSSQFPEHPHAFLFGVMTSSFIWFTLLTVVAYYFSKALTTPSVWRHVECLSGGLMIYLSLKLILNQAG